MIENPLIWRRYGGRPCDRPVGLRLQDRGLGGVLRGAGVGCGVLGWRL
jgi:hypothetical protein